LRAGLNDSIHQPGPFIFRVRPSACVSQRGGGCRDRDRRPEDGDRILRVVLTFEVSRTSKVRPFWQAAVSLIGLAVTAYFFIHLAARFFRADTLLSSGSLSWRRIAGELRR